MSQKLLDPHALVKQRRRTSRSWAQAKRQEDAAHRQAVLSTKDAWALPLKPVGAATSTEERTAGQSDAGGRSYAQKRPKVDSVQKEPPSKRTATWMYLPTGPKLRLGQAVLQRSMDKDLLKQMAEAKPTREHLVNRKGLILSELATITAYEAIKGKAVDEHVQKLERQIEKNEADMAKAAALIKSLRAELDVQKAAKEEVEKAAVEAQAKAEEAAKAGQAEIEKLQHELKENAEVADARYKQLEASLPSQIVEAISEYKASPAFREALVEETVTMYSDGYLHLARRAMADTSLGLGLNLEALARLICQDSYDEAARSLHYLVPFSENALRVIASNDAQAGRPVWVPPPVDPQNMNAIIERIEDEVLSTEEDE